MWESDPHRHGDARFMRVGSVGRIINDVSCEAGIVEFPFSRCVDPRI
jgi:hypothetical protein